MVYRIFVFSSNSPSRWGLYIKQVLTRTVNVMALSASMAILNFDKHILSESIRYVFRTKPKIAENNVLAGNFVYDHVKLQFKPQKT